MASVLAVGATVAIGAAIASQGFRMSQMTVPVPDIIEKEYKRYAPNNVHLAMHSGSSIPVIDIEQVGENAYQIYQLNGGMFDIHTSDIAHYIAAHNITFVEPAPDIANFQAFNKRPDAVTASRWRNANKSHGRRRGHDKGRRARAKGAGGR